MPMRQQILLLQGHFIWSITKTKFNGVLLKVLQEQLNSPGDPWTKSWLGLQREIGVIPSFEIRSSLAKTLLAAAIGYVLKVKFSHSTKKTVPQPLDWYKLQPHVNNFLASKL